MVESMGLFFLLCQWHGALGETGYKTETASDVTFETKQKAVVLKPRG